MVRLDLLLLADNIDSQQPVIDAIETEVNNAVLALQAGRTSLTRTSRNHPTAATTEPSPTETATPITPKPSQPKPTVRDPRPT